MFTWVPESEFPWAILAANTVGCALLGWLAIRPLRDDAHQHAATIGFCGGLTTFSTFAVELAVLRTEDPGTMWVYLSASLIAGLAAFLSGRAAAGAT